MRRVHTLFHRCGRFQVTGKEFILASMGDGEAVQKKLLAIFGKVIITRAEESVDGRWYFGYSDLFDEIEEGAKVPEYRFEVIEDEVKAYRRKDGRCFWCG